ncbi:MAG: hypothetical protein PHR30_10540 [Gallionellaceae bacterium]|nr:hypothetical protein [Gallionellaceae bacterium]MDD5365767.1 hypothetical protein [Gallionellaceae bacterium]
MLAIRLLIGLVGVLIVLSLLGYAASRDPRWLRFAGLSFKGGVALVAILMLIFLAERLLMVL